MGFLKLGRSAENPATSLSNPDTWLYEAFGSQPTYSGTTVNELTARNYAAYYAAVAIIAKGVASVPAILYRREGRGKVRADDERVYHLLHTRPNPAMTAYTYHETMTAHAASWGNAYAEIERDRGGRPVAIWPMNPADCRVVFVGDRLAAQSAQLVRGVKYIAVKVPTNSTPPVGVPLIEGEAYLQPGRYVHIPGLGDGLSGVSMASQGKEALGLGLALQEFAARFFGQGAKSATIIQPREGYDLDPKAREKLRLGLSQQMAGLSQAHRMAVVEAGLDIHTIGVNPADAQALESRQYQVLEISRYFDIPPYRLGADDNGQSYASIEAKQLDLAQWTHRPWLIRTEQVYTWELAPDMPVGVSWAKRLDALSRSKYTFEFLFEGLLRADSKARAEYHRTMWSIGAVTINEIRAKENLNPLPAAEADEVFIPLNVSAMSDFALDEAEGEESVDVEKERSVPVVEMERYAQQQRAVNRRQALQRSYREVLRRAAEHIVLPEVRKLARVVKKSFENPAEWQGVLLREMNEFWDEQLPDVIRREMTPVILAYARLLADLVRDEVGAEEAFDLDAAVDDWVATYTNRHIKSSRGQIKALMEQEEAEAELLDRAAQWEETRPERIARLESTKAANSLVRTMFAAAGVLVLRWVAGGKSSYCSEMDGRTVGIEQPFLHAGDNVEVEGSDPMGTYYSINHPPVHDGCDCIIVAG